MRMFLISIMYNTRYIIIAKIYVPVGWVSGVSTLLFLASCEEAELTTSESWRPQTAPGWGIPLDGIVDRFQLFYTPLLENPFVSCRQFYSDSIGWKGGNPSRCRCYHPSLTLRSLASIDWFVLRVSLYGQGPCIPYPLCPIDSNYIPPSAHFRTQPTTCFVPLKETRWSVYISHP